MKKPGKILIVDDDEYILISLKLLLDEHFEKVTILSEPDTLIPKVKDEPYDVYLLDMNFSQGETSGKEGLDLLKQLKVVLPEVSVIMMTAYGEVNSAVEAMKAGATDFITKPWENERLLATVTNAIQLSRKSSEIIALKSRQKAVTRSSKPSGVTMIGSSEVMQEVISFIDKVAPTDANVLLLGENGTGKEVAARTIHETSKRKNEVFITVDLGSISEQLFESELFGHKKGAFTDAKEDRMGRFEAANKGTLFLDEIGNLPLSLQAKLLTALQSKKITRLGTSQTIEVDVRIVCATNSDLRKMVDIGKFREDLYYRINTMELTLPPLRDRKADIELLVKHFLSVYSRKYQKSDLHITPRALEELKNYNWPGNIRELQHAIERAVILTDEDKIALPAFSLPFSDRQENAQFDSYNLEGIEAWAVKKALLKHNGNVSHAAKELGLSRGAMYRRMEKYGL
ncbi:MAG: sigma-54 dependent transcriptional regulator [Bacteroidota bacterium]